LVVSISSDTGPLFRLTPPQHPAMLPTQSSRSHVNKNEFLTGSNRPILLKNSVSEADEKNSAPQTNFNGGHQSQSKIHYETPGIVRRNKGTESTMLVVFRRKLMLLRFGVFQQNRPKAVNRPWIMDVC